MQASIAGALVLGGFGIVAMITSFPLGPISYYYAGLILIFMFGYTFLKARFIWATFAGWVIVIFYEIGAIWYVKTPVSILVNNNFFFIGANVIGMLACYSIEYYARRDFFLARLLESEKEKVKAANRELEKRVKERTSQLVKINKDLLQEMSERKRMEQELIQAHKMEAIGTLAGGIAHDFNNILSAIISYAEIGLYKQNIDDAKRKYSFEQILQAGSRARDLVKQILTFSRQREQERVSVKTSVIIKEALKMLSATLPKNISIRQNITADSDMVLADPIQIHQILINLCTNAAHAMQEKGGVLEVSLHEVYIDPQTETKVSDLPAGEYLEISVSDTGTGIEASVIERIFDPYFTTKQPGKGTGMGLSVVHGIARSHGGTITVDGAVGKGTTFHVYLPKLEGELTSTTEKEIPIPSGHESILFVDDEEALVDVGKEMMEEFGYKVVTCTDATEALKVFRAEPEKFDLVITDKSMPHMSGFELAEELFRIRSDTSVILLTGFSDTADMEKAKAEGFKDLVMKPLVMREMAETIRRVLDQKSQEL
jgi:signal transduction histidine kinase/ActR/RegA family two-component response regulator